MIPAKWIGNTNPTEKLDIAGNIKIMGTGNNATGTITGGVIDIKYQFERGAI